jgi:hypothetical protein
MNRIKNIALSTLFSLLAFSAITYTACNKDECKDVVCANGGTCVGGACQCTAGYEGSDCKTLSTTKFIRTWTGHWVNTADPTKNGAYSSIISQGATFNTISITNFFDYFVHPVTATVNGTTATISLQSPDGTASVSGSGVFQNNQISFTYSVTNSGTTKNYTDTFQ